MAITVNADVVWDEIWARREWDDEITNEQYERLKAIPDELVELLINEKADDWFWDAFDSLRSDVIAALMGMVEK